MQKQLKTDDTIKTEIRLGGGKPPVGGKRCWNLTICENDGPPDDAELQDEFTQAEYSEHFQFAVDGSFQASQDEGRDRQRTSIRVTKRRIEEYGANLLRRLCRLDRLEHGQKKRDILIIEAARSREAEDDNDEEDEEDDERSLHNPVWELLEDTGRWNNTKPDRVSITRILSAPDLDTSHSSDEGLGTEKPLRILLVIARSLLHRSDGSQTYWKYDDEKITPGIIQQGIMQVMQHLKQIGHRRKVQLDILRPGSFREIEQYLGIDSRTCLVAKREELFDLVHLDMHGVMKAIPAGSEEQPYLQFTVFPQLKDRSPDTYMSPDQVAIALCQRTRLLVMNACNSSGVRGGLGIRMIRPFLRDQRMAQVAATSYRLTEKAASIFYPAFYMSLLLKGSFNGAAADGRQALREEKIRYGEERDDAYVHWNWSSTEKLHKVSEPQRTIWLLMYMLMELLPRCFWMLCMCTEQKRQVWRRTHAEHFPMYDVHQNFGEIKAHVQSSRQIDIPRITLYAMEIEYHLKTSRHHSVYIHTAHEDSSTELRVIKDLVLNMVRIWTDTNFVTEIRVLDVEKMLVELMKPSWLKRPSWPTMNYENLADSADWSWHQRSEILPRLEPKIKSLLIVCGIEKLVPLNDSAKSSVLDQISKTAQQFEETQEDEPQHREFYVITTGGLSPDRWQKDLPHEFDQETIGRKWSSGEIMMIPFEKDIEFSTYSRKRPRNAGAGSHQARDMV